MKQLITILFISSIIILLSSNGMIAQDKVELSGQVKDAQTKNSLEFCTVSIFNTKDSIIGGTVTDNKGFFTMPLDRGNYRFVLRFIGYKTGTTEVITVTENKFLGVFKLESDKNILNEIIIKTSLHENLLDRDIQIVTDKLRKGASNTKEVLDKLNGVDYDRFNMQDSG